MSSSALTRVSHYLGIKLRDSIVFILITVSLVGGGSYLYAAWTNITPTQTQSGAPVTQSLMDAIRTNLDELYKIRIQKPEVSVAATNIVQSGIFADGSKNIVASIPNVVPGIYYVSFRGYNYTTVPQYTSGYAAGSSGVDTYTYLPMQKGETTDPFINYTGIIYIYTTQTVIFYYNNADAVGGSSFNFNNNSQAGIRKIGAIQ